jgi:hypothetical protein
MALTPEAYAAKKQRRVERLQNAAARTQAESEAQWKQGDLMFSVIPFGQPIQVGHYSEKRDRNHRARAARHLDKACELAEQAKDLSRRAEAAANNAAIFSDDPQATEKLADKIARLEKRQELMKAANKLVRKQDRAGLLAMGFSETRVTLLFTPDFCGRLGFPDYAITNNGANIRRMKERITHLEKHAQDESSEKEIGDVRIVDSVEDDRVQIYFPGKPPSPIISSLKSYGFRWTPSLGCWQLNRSNQATWKSNQIAEKYNEVTR